MRDVQVQVLGLESSQTRSGKTMYSVQLSNGEKVTTFDYALAQKASQSGGQLVTARIEDVVKGQSTYHNLKEIALPGEQLSVQMPQAGTVIPMGGSIPIQQAAPRSSGGGGGGMSPEDKLRVTRLSCISNAATLVAALISVGAEGVDPVATTLSFADQFVNAVIPPAAVATVVQQQAVVAPQGVVTPEMIQAALAAAGQNVQLGTAGVAPVPEATTGLPWSQ